jgi:hypothetical protein
MKINIPKTVVTPFLTDINYWKKLLCILFKVLTVMGIKVAVLWDISPCSLIDIDRYFRDAYCLDDGGSKYL